MNTNPVDAKVDNSIACIFTMMLPGLGQMLKNQVIAGIIFSVVVGGGYLINGWLGLGLHLICILDAAFSSQTKSVKHPANWTRRLLMFTGLGCLLVYTCLRTALF